MWSQDESKILVNQLDDTVRISDAVTGTELTRLEGRNDDVTAVMWSRGRSEDPHSWFQCCAHLGCRHWCKTDLTHWSRRTYQSSDVEPG